MEPNRYSHPNLNGLQRKCNGGVLNTLQFSRIRTLQSDVVLVVLINLQRIPSSYSKRRRQDDLRRLNYVSVKELNNSSS